MPGSSPQGRLKGWGRVQNSTYSEYGHVAYQIKENGLCGNMVTTILPADRLARGSKFKIHLFSEHRHVAYQIIGKDKCSNTQAHLLFLHTHPWLLRLGQRSKYFFLKKVMLHIKLMGMEHRAPCKQMFCPYTHPGPLGWGRKVKHLFTVSSHIAYQIKGNGT